MNRLPVILALTFLVLSSAASAMTDQEVRRKMIRDSIASYSGSCPCPYSITRNGQRCGGRSAWSKPGGAEPLCYERDITYAMVAAYRKRNNIN